MLRWSIGTWVVLLVLTLALPALADPDLESAKAQGVVGERADGYLGIVVASPTPEVKALADHVNAKRRAAYQEIARKNGTDVDAVAAMAGAKLVERTPRGGWVTDASGNWRRK